MERETAQEDSEWLTHQTPGRAPAARVGVVGATGITGVELVNHLSRHPAVELVFGTSRDQAGNSLDSIDPAAAPLELIHPDAATEQQVDLVFLCLPHGASAPTAERWFERGARVVDLSGDLRLRDRALHDRIYATERSAALERATVYGLPELDRTPIREAQVVSNPGCYATAVALGLLPLAAAGALGDGAYVDAKSGVSGAGRKPSATTHFCSANDDVRPYKIGRVHRHVPEMEQTLAAVAGGRPVGPLVFVPHLIPVDRGILATCAVRGSGLDAGRARAIYADLYGGEPFVRLLPAGRTARIRGTGHTNRAVVSVDAVDEADLLVVACAIDNLGKGAAGQAVQNMNLMLDLPEGLGLAA